MNDITFNHVFEFSPTDREMINPEWPHWYSSIWVEVSYKRTALPYLKREKDVFDKTKYKRVKELMSVMLPEKIPV